MKKAKHHKKAKAQHKKAQKEAKEDKKDAAKEYLKGCIDMNMKKLINLKHGLKSI